LLDALSLSIVNRVFGSAVGGFKAALLLSVAFLVLMEIDFPSDELKQESTLYQPVARVLPETWDAASQHVPDLKRISEQFGRRIESELPSAAQ
jgi:membrane protein required for colicin V production